ncbi:rab protein geranylgeranyltransferase subunit a [Vairimorpha apis BRL 01]|uniref:Rab protein geranylgeranyltransferase subunit a n=1 Tax=Vairimorpha apis BRL 01 TaxID=1037528 RepID=T0MI13_9MICR|nr:rab protein geranylgeranyltransferase subunit a [Vairimorpha apis BRL 01]
MIYSFFDLAFEGTSIEDLLQTSKFNNQSIIVFDKQNEYGSTFSDIQNLKDNLQVKNLQVFKNNSKIIFELDMKFLSSSDELVKIIDKSGINEFLNFVVVKKRYYVDNDQIYLVPQTIKELIECEWLNIMEKYYISKYLKKEISFEIMENNLKYKTKEIFSIMLHSIQNDFYYPVYGYKEISELLSRSLAINNVAFILDKNISIKIKDELNNQNKNLISDDKLNYKFKISRKSDIIFCKNLYTKKLQNVKKYVRILNIKNNVFKEMSFGFINYNCCKFNFFIVDSNSKCCKEGTYILYIFSEFTKINNNICQMLKFKNDDILFDISFEIYKSKHEFFT